MIPGECQRLHLPLQFLYSRFQFLYFGLLGFLRCSNDCHKRSCSNNTPPSDTAAYSFNKIAKKIVEKQCDFLAMLLQAKTSQENRNLFSRKISSAQKSEWEFQCTSEVRGARRFSRQSCDFFANVKIRFKKSQKNRNL